MSEIEDIGDRLLVIFDGQCGLCNRTVRWFLSRDRLDRLRFIPSEAASLAPLLARHEVVASAGAGPDTILVVRRFGQPGEQVLTRSTAVLTLLQQLLAPWPGVAGALRLLPRPLRDAGYRLIARYRYRIWGRLQACPLPTPAERARFL